MSLKPMRWGMTCFMAILAVAFMVNMGIAKKRPAAKTKPKNAAVEWFNKASKLNAEFTKKEGAKHSALAEVIRLYSKALTVNPKYADAFRNRGRAYADQDDYERALEDYNQALALNPKDAESYLRRGMAYDKTGDYDRALEDYNQALKINPDYGDAYLNRGMAYMMFSDLEKGLDDFKKACNLGNQKACETLRKNSK